MRWAPSDPSDTSPPDSARWSDWRIVRAGNVSQQVEFAPAAGDGDDYWVQTRAAPDTADDPCWVPWAGDCADVESSTPADCEVMGRPWPGPCDPARPTQRVCGGGGDWGCPAGTSFRAAGRWCVTVTDFWAPLSRAVPGVCNPPAGAALSPSPAGWCGQANAQFRSVEVAPSTAAATTRPVERTKLVSVRAGSPSPVIPALPINAEPTSSSRVVITWPRPAASARVVQHQIRWKVAGTPSWTEWAPGPLASSRDEVCGPGGCFAFGPGPVLQSEAAVCGLAANTVYEFDVAAVTSTGRGPGRAIRSAATHAAGTGTGTGDQAVCHLRPPGPPPPPVRLASGGFVGYKSSDGLRGWVNLAWGNPGDRSITGYEMKWTAPNTGKSAAWAPIAGSGPDTTSAVVTGLDPDQQHVFRVRAVNASGPGHNLRIPARADRGGAGRVTTSTVWAGPGDGPPAAP